jgi:hypothetical protein
MYFFSPTLTIFPWFSAVLFDTVSISACMRDNPMLLEALFSYNRAILVFFLALGFMTGSVFVSLSSPLNSLLSWSRVASS